jgi:serine/threonine protein phosphatase Stp1
MTAEQAIQAVELPVGKLRSSAASHPGARRARNEDALLSRPDLGLWAVADGAGGHSNGETAARAVVEALATIPAALTAAEMLIQVRLRLSAVHETLHEAASRLGEGAMMAATVVALIERDGHFACLWAGDSRAYLVRGGMVEQLTVDHSLVQDLVDRGSIDPADAEAHPDANVITRAIGATGVELVLDKRMGEVLEGDRFMLCSDGLVKSLPAPDLRGLLSDGAAADALVAAALEQGATDNVTAVVVSVPENPV